MSAERIRIFEANTHFGRMLNDDTSMARLLGDGALTLGAFNEVHPRVRRVARAAIEAHSGYHAVFPEGTRLDTVWAVSNDLSVVSHPAFPFRKGLQRLGGVASGRRRDVGIHGIVVETPGGRRVRGSHQHLSPPVFEPLRRPQVRAMHDVLGNNPYFVPDDETLDVSVGDNNHFPAPWKIDRRIAALGYKDLSDGSGTCDIASTHPRLARAVHALGTASMPQLDAVYARPPQGGELVPCTDADAAQLAPHQIGYRTERVAVASDHLATELTLYFA